MKKLAMVHKDVAEQSSQCQNPQNNYNDQRNKSVILRIVATQVKITPNEVNLIIEPTFYD